jgi:hypothetical protein
VQESDVPAFAHMMNRSWLDMVAREGTVRSSSVVEVAPDSEPPCPACGTAAPLVDGACSDCGLQLA